MTFQNGNKTTDRELIELSIQHSYIVITKDADFWDIYNQKAEPYKLIYLTVGNLSSHELISLFDLNLKTIIEKITESYVIEINTKNIIAIV